MTGVTRSREITAMRSQIRFRLNIMSEGTLLHLTLGVDANLVKGMKLSAVQIKRLVRSVYQELDAHKAIIAKVPEAKILERGEQAINDEYALEQQLDQEVNKMLDDLERKNPGEFQRHKMFSLVKKKLAQEKGFIL